MSWESYIFRTVLVFSNIYLQRDMSSDIEIVLVRLGSYGSLLHWSVCTQVSNSSTVTWSFWMLKN